MSVLSLTSTTFASDLYVSYSGNGSECSSSNPCASIAVASGNTVLRNEFEDNVAGGLINDGKNNIIK